ncbi:MAG TPA: hypothetical protein DDX84_11395 [Nitrospiraceae bacterium]|nr:MAG: hypothetical protein A2Z60_02020 [Nitrospirae bacterium RIFCSPLOWO2_02_42_7]OGW55746.1 MAG: hypothetical protein A3D21_04415 [Nitrospirae bacterium RIFCSPHIGHO2_02_FULL_42_12]HBI24776.1 hypothetical protein [Nitrospiraceae bacterium]
MQPAKEILREKLSKRVLSNKTTREGMLASFIVTMMKYYTRKGTNPSEDEVRKTIYDYAGEAFTSINVDFEFPNLEDLKRVKALIEERLGASSLKEDAPEIFSEHERICNVLFGKYEG